MFLSDFEGLVDILTTGKRGDSVSESINCLSRKLFTEDTYSVTRSLHSVNRAGNFFLKYFTVDTQYNLFVFLTSVSPVPFSCPHKKGFST